MTQRHRPLSAADLSPELIARFDSRVNRSAGPDACWPWTGMVSPRRGYGRLKTDSNHEIRPHRIAYALVNGPIPAERLVCHRCDNPLCCNPAHLWLGSDGDNVQDAIAKGRWHRPGTQRTPRWMRMTPEPAPVPQEAP